MSTGVFTYYHCSDFAVKYCRGKKKRQHFHKNINFPKSTRRISCRTYSSMLSLLSLHPEVICDFSPHQYSSRGDNSELDMIWCVEVVEGRISWNLQLLHMTGCDLMSKHRGNNILHICWTRRLFMLNFAAGDLSITVSHPFCIVIWKGGNIWLEHVRNTCMVVLLLDDSSDRVSWVVQSLL